MENQATVFISYSHRDKEKVWSLASFLGQLGLKTWFDDDELVAGQSIIQEISAAISKSDLYIVCLSKHALESRWVMHELNTALTLETTKGKPKVLPIIVGDCELPITLSGRLYVNMTNSLSEARDRIFKAVQKYHSNTDPALLKELTSEVRKTMLSSVSLVIEDKTVRSFGGILQEYDEDKVEKEAKDLLKSLRKHANGALLNFLQAEDMDFSSPFPVFPNGDYSERIHDVGGPFEGSVSKQAIVEVKILNPDEEKLLRFMSKVERYKIDKIAFTFLLSPPILGLAQRSLQRLQEKYEILGWDYEEGFEIELPDDLHLCVWCRDEQLRISLETKYSFQFEKRIKDFSVREFINWLLDDKK